MRKSSLLRTILALAAGAAVSAAVMANIGYMRAEEPAQTGTTPPAATAAPERAVPQSENGVLLSFAPVVKQAGPAVVNIYTQKTVTVNASPFANDPFFRRFFGNQSPFGIPQERILRSLGSGVIVKPDGTIVTNTHVIGGADTIRVVLADRREFDADVVLADERTDLAVLRLRAEGQAFPYLQFRDSDTVEVGDLALAIGNPFGLGQTVTSGIVSATARSNVGITDYQFFIQTDAAVNMGNSGGALVGLDGRLIGINSNIISRTGDSAGIGFAIPSNMVRHVVDAALADGEVVRAWIGVSGQAVTNEIAQSLGLDRPGGILVDNLYPGGPADQAGIRPGDVILKVGGKDVLDVPSMNFRIATADPGKVASFRIWRDGSDLNLNVRLALPPESPSRNVTTLSGRNPFQQVTVANLSPRLADEMGFDFMERGVVVLEIEPGSPAGRRNFVRKGDIILNLNGTTIAEVSDLDAALAVESQDYVYQLKRQGRTLECGIIGARSFYCREL